MNMHPKWFWPLAFAMLSTTTHAGSRLREVTGTSCKAISIKVGVGLTTQVVFEQEPKTTLLADQSHFKIVTNGSAKRSIAIIPTLAANELEALGAAGPTNTFVAALNGSLKTNLFVFFDSQNQLMIELSFAAKDSADYLVKVTQRFDERCAL